MKKRKIIFVFFIIFFLNFVSAHNIHIVNEKEGDIIPNETKYKETYNEDELFPKEMSPEESETIKKEPWIEKDTDNKGIYYEIHYDEYERAFRVEDYFIRGYKGVTEYEFFSRLQRREYQDHYGYEWVISKEIGTFYKEDKIIATRIITFDKQGNKINEEKEGSTIIISIMRFLSNFYNIPAPEALLFLPLLILDFFFKTTFPSSPTLALYSTSLSGLFNSIQ